MGWLCVCVCVCWEGGGGMMCECLASYQGRIRARREAFPFLQCSWGTRLVNAMILPSSPLSQPASPPTPFLPSPQLTRFFPSTHPLPPAPSKTWLMMMNSSLRYTEDSRYESNKWSNSIGREPVCVCVSVSVLPSIKRELALTIETKQLADMV